MGSDLSPRDEQFILGLTEQILHLFSYREELEKYIRNRMMTVAPNLCQVVGEIVAAKLIARAGSLVNLAKCSGSTLQIIGSEKALFKALKSKGNTPKFGIIFQTKILQSSEGKSKGKMARAVASKAALCVRYDVLGGKGSDFGQS